MGSVSIAVSEGMRPEHLAPVPFGGGGFVAER